MRMAGMRMRTQPARRPSVAVRRLRQPATRTAPRRRRLLGARGGRARPRQVCAFVAVRRGKLVRRLAGLQPHQLDLRPQTQHQVTHPAQNSKQAARPEGGRARWRAYVGCWPGRGRACAGRWKSDSLRRARFLTSRRVLRSLYVTRPSPNRNQNVLRAAGSCGLFTLKVYSRTHSSATSSASLRAGRRPPRAGSRSSAGDACPCWPVRQRHRLGRRLGRTESRTGGTAAAAGDSRLRWARGGSAP